MIHWAVFLLIGSSLVPPAPAAAPGVKAMGVYPLLLPGLQAIPAGRPKVYLWCQGLKLLGVMVPDESQLRPPATTTQGRLLPTAILLRNGRCDQQGGAVSFGFLLPMKAWIFGTAVRAAPEERTTWLLHRFQGTVNDGQLKGVLVQVDVNQPGFAFQEAKVEVPALGDDQASFADEKAWLEEITRTLSLVRSEP
jgi:hypothetical protein